MKVMQFGRYVRLHPMIFVGRIVRLDLDFGCNPFRPQRGETERVGFEPTVESPPHTLSKRAP